METLLFIGAVALGAILGHVLFFVAVGVGVRFLQRFFNK